MAQMRPHPDPILTLSRGWGAKWPTLSRGWGPPVGGPTRMGLASPESDLTLSPPDGVRP